MAGLQQELCRRLRTELEKEISELEQRLQLLQLLLSIVETQCGSGSGEKLHYTAFRDREGRLAASLQVGGDYVRLSFAKPMPRSNPYIKYLLRSVRQVAEEYPDVEVGEEGDAETLRGIMLRGLSRDAREDALLTIEYVLKKLGLAASRGGED